MYDKDTVVYHCLPYGLRDFMGRSVASCYVISATDLRQKTRACHESQRKRLDTSQGLDDAGHAGYEPRVGRLSGHFRMAEGWRFHNYRGFCAEGANLLAEDLGDLCIQHGGTRE